MSKLKIIKASGKKVIFDAQKLIASMKKAGVSDQHPAGEAGGDAGGWKDSFGCFSKKITKIMN